MNWDIRAHVNHWTRLQTNRWKQIQTWIIQKYLFIYYNMINIISSLLQQYEAKKQRMKSKLFIIIISVDISNMRRISVLFFWDSDYIHGDIQLRSLSISHTPKSFFWLPFIYWIYSVYICIAFGHYGIWLGYMLTFIMGS